MGSRTQCLKITSQVWLSIANTIQDCCNKFFMFQASSFKGQEINATSSISLPFCKMGVTNKEFDWVHWQQYKSEKPKC